MPIGQRQVVEGFGAAALANNGVVFVGAGMSMGAGYPSWDDLAEPLRAGADIPALVADAPLVANYYGANLGRSALEASLLAVFAAIGDPHPTAALRNIARVPVTEFWTTNYDWLLERCLPVATRITRDDDYASHRDKIAAQRLTKMHGTLSDPAGSGSLRWEQPPTITRHDFETYETTHRRMWSVLQALFLSRSFLFVGLSFADPNVELLLRLSRSIPEQGPPHYTVLRRSADTEQRRVDELRRDDLETSGVAVYEIDAFEELDEFAALLARRTREPVLYVTGSYDEANHDVRNLVRNIGSRLATDPDIKISSLAGPAGLDLSRAFKDTVTDGYSPDRLRFYFRRRSEPPANLPQRMGTSIHENLDREPLREMVIDDARAVLAVAGATNTCAEVDHAIDRGIPVIPVATSGGSAQEIWAARGPEILRIDGSDTTALWGRLNDPDQNVAAAAAVRLIRQCMFLDPAS